MKTKNLVMTALFAAVLCVAAPFTLPIGPIPLSLATLVIYVAASVLDWKLATLALLVYILLGAVGLPVFSNMTGGFQKIAGVTGGFIVGYLPCAMAVGLMIKGLRARRWSYPVAMLLGTALLYACGTAWFTVAAHTTVSKAVMTCVVPFLPGDAIKIVVASALAPMLRARLGRVGAR
jgi:biotin transport system substrate-specific component